MPDEKSFVHLHVHTEYSLLDGLSNIKRLVKRAADNNMPALAITDHGTMFGVIDFYRACKAAGVKPIIGMEAYLSRRGMTDRDPQFDTKPYHLLLLAKNETGYKNLLKLATAAQLHGYYYRPRVDHDMLAAHAEGLICTSGCLAAEIPRYVEDGREQEALRKIGWYQDVFGKDNFFLELQHHDIDILHTLNRWLIEKQDFAGVPLLATNDVHYIRPDDYDAHDTLLCIQTGNLKVDMNRLKMTDPSYHLRTPDEMWRLFAEVPEALSNSLRIADMCDVNLDSKGYHLPVFPVPDGFTAQTYLRYLCEKGLEWRYGSHASDPTVTKRLSYELDVIHNMGFDTYFLIVWDLCEFARHADIWWNVRGSGAGSVAAYCLGITSVDPLSNRLIFERFLNPGRVSMPDIDMDFPEDRRAEMIQYCAQKYGEDKVAAIITFGTMGSKAAIRDVGRALDMPLPEVDRIARLIPTAAKAIKFEDALGDDPEKALPELKEVYANDETARKLIDVARALEGVTRHASTHAAGIIIADKPLVEYIPLHRVTSGSGEEAPVKMVTQFPMETCESIGLLKVDFLGLSTLTIMRTACELIERYHGIHYDLSNIPYRPDPDDPETTRKVEEMFKMIGRGETIGVFQLESQGMRRMLTDMRPKEFENIVAAVALYRPGPMDYIPTYNKRLHGEEPVTYLHPKLEPILDYTYAIIIYQEQIQQIANELFGYSLGDADMIRKAVSKKKKEELLKHRATFVERGPEHGVDSEAANRIFDDIEFFARYGFNRCLPEDVEVIDAATGRLVRIGDLANGTATIEHTLTCNIPTLTLQNGPVTAVMANGVKPVYRLTTQLGRQIEATDNHPFYTFDGWRMLGELKVGEQIALPRRIPVEGRREWPDHKVIVLGHLLAEGNLRHTHGAYYYTTDAEQLQDYVSNLEQFQNTTATIARHKNAYSIYSRRTDRSQESEAVIWLHQIGAWGKDAHNKEIPAEAFELNNRQLGLLLARMWEGDGHVDEDRRNVFYATASERLAYHVQHLLLRFGIISRVRRVMFPYKDGRIGYQVFVTAHANLRKFAESVGCHFISQKRFAELQHIIAAEPTTFSTKDVVPMGVQRLIREQKDATGLTWDQVSEKAGVAKRLFFGVDHVHKAGLARSTTSKMANFFDCAELRAYAESDIYWDCIASIEYAGEKPTYDLTVPDTHNFVANDFIVHNSHATDYAVMTCQTAFLKCHYPHEYMTALMSVHLDDSAKVSLFAADCSRMGIKILPPDINASESGFTVEKERTGERSIRFGLAAVKNVGLGPVDHILECRKHNGPFGDLDDFCRCVDLRIVQKRAMESLIRVGAFDQFGPRPAILAALDRMMSFSADYHKAKDVGQMSLFGDVTGVDMGGDSILSHLSDVPDVSRREQLRWEKELVGLYVTDHPLKMVMGDLQHIITHTSTELIEAGEAANGRSVAIAGLVTDVRSLVTKKGDTMAILTIEDITGTISAVMFPRTWAEHRDKVKVDTVLVVRGKADTSRGDVQIIVDSVTQNFAKTEAAEPLPDLTSLNLSWMVEEPTSGESTSSPYDEETGEYRREPVVPDPAPAAAEAVMPATAGASIPSAPPIEPPSMPHRASSEGRLLTEREMPGWLEEELDNGWAPKPDIHYDDQGHITEPETNGNGSAFDSSGQVAPPKAPADRPQSTRKPSGKQTDKSDEPEEPPLPLRRRSAPKIPQLPQEPGRLLALVIPRSEDSARDRRKMQRLHGFLTQYPGQDHFCFLIEGGGKKRARIDYPNHPIRINEDILKFARDLLGEDNVLIEELE